jgi:hypothetical protein
LISIMSDIMVCILLYRLGVPERTMPVQLSSLSLS